MVEEFLYKNENGNIPSFAVGIVGGGLAGLSLSILLAQQGYKTILFEKDKYPFHKVCGEYVSLESWHFIENLGLNLSYLNLPIIKNLIVSSPNGNFIQTKLGMGGFGISRYLLDNQLKEIAAKNGVLVYEETKVNEVIFNDEKFTIKYNSGAITAQVVAGSFGKRSNLDIKWQRDFVKQKTSKLNNYIGVKYHIKTSFPDNTIALHNFKNGYCGISKIEGNKFCLCYLTSAQNLKENHNSIKKMETNVLFQNPFLKRIFSESEFLFKDPVIISQISFDKKSLIENHILMLGDAAGMITPLCGNGMSMAMRSAKIAFENINSFLKKEITREKMESQFVSQWQKNSRVRLRNGRLIQKLFGKTKTTNLFIRIIKHFPSLIRKMIRMTHGNEFY